MPESTAVELLRGVVDGIDWLQATQSARQAEMCKLAKLHCLTTYREAKTRLEVMIADRAEKEYKWSRALPVCATVREILVSECQDPPQKPAASPSPPAKKPGRELAKWATIMAAHLVVTKLHS